ncbi:hypothetical protein [Demequina subtropica]|uniref:hypothetical protein n=1 Tax=Demequina subtropica TaxID=1638989 RepID=UPI000784A8B8|nr:hypothetical protein [Demequina subtropica]
MKVARHLVGTVGAVLIAVLATGCTGDDGDLAAAGTPTPDPTATAAASTAATPEESSTTSPAASSTPDSSQAAGIPTREPSTTPAPTGGSQADVEVELTRYAITGDTLSGGGVVYDVVEEDGTCTLTVSTGSATASASGPATRSAGTMACGSGLDVDVAALSGTLTVVLAYDSDAYKGSSEPVEVAR